MCNGLLFFPLPYQTMSKGTRVLSLYSYNVYREIRYFACMLKQKWRTTVAEYYSYKSFTGLHFYLDWKKSSEEVLLLKETVFSFCCFLFVHDSLDKEPLPFTEFPIRCVKKAQIKVPFDSKAIRCDNLPPIASVMPLWPDNFEACLARAKINVYQNICWASHCKLYVKGITQRDTQVYKWPLFKGFNAFKLTVDWSYITATKGLAYFCNFKAIHYF